MKIVYCTDSICYLGGIQRITIAKASALANIVGNEVWIIVTDHRKEIVLPINSKVHIINLNVNYFADDWRGKWYVLKGILQKRRLHKKLLAKQLEIIQPDIVIATGTSEKNFLPTIRISTSPIFIREIHNHKYYRRDAAATIFAKCMAILGDIIDYNICIKKYDKIVILSKEDKERNWKKDAKVVVIPNPLTANVTKQSTCSEKRVIAAGRLAYQKHFDALIDAWYIVHKAHTDWQLDIWGDGTEKEALQNQINQYGLQDTVQLKGYAQNVIEKMHNYSIFALSSRFEGFGLVILEAMANGVPVVSFACPCGPKDIITDGKDGILIPHENTELLAQGIINLIEDEAKRIDMGQNAVAKAKQFNTDTIIQQWMDLFTQQISIRNGK